VKYIVLLLRMDNNGEGGTLSLTALAFQRWATFRMVLALGITGAAMFYGSSLITPPLSVLSAVEGLKVATPAFEPYVLPITIALLVALFAVQSRGTGKVAVLFGPITIIWFIAIALTGALHIADDPGVIAAINLTMRSRLWPATRLDRR
jgi:KUP system potassium uptake protein